MQIKGEAKEDKCKVHQTILNYFCITCQTPICSDCALLGKEVFA
jgi:hypothetical protein